jgi:hypothetical protein
MEIAIRKATTVDIELIAANNAALALETEDRRLDPAIVREGVAAALADRSKGPAAVRGARQCARTTDLPQLRSRGLGLFRNGR